MNEHLSPELLQRVADGEAADDAAAAQHISECAICANGVLATLQLKRAIAALPRRVPAAPRVAVRRHARAMWVAAAAAVAVIVMLGTFATQQVRGRDAARELVDLHSTIIGSAQPIDVVSTDRHTVKPWFEGRVPFAVNVPELSGTPFSVAGGKVVFWRGRTGAYLLVRKGAHRISVLIFEGGDLPNTAAVPQMTVESWRSAGLTYIAIGDIPRNELLQLRSAFGG